MKEFNRDEYNRLCAKFLGYKQQSHPNFGNYFVIHRILYLVSEMEFDSNWEWIHTIINKISKIKVSNKGFKSPIFEERYNVIYSRISAPKKHIIQCIWEFLNKYYEKV